MALPDLSQFRLHKVIDDIDLDGVVIPGLRGSFHRRGKETAGLYTYEGREIFCAWGYVGEEHCRFTAYRRRGGWTPPHAGCPELDTVLALIGPVPPPAAYAADSGSGRLVSGVPGP